MRCIVVAWLSLAACAGRWPQPPPDEQAPAASARRPAAVAGPFTFAPSRDAVARYNDAQRPIAATPFADAVGAVTRDEALRAGLAIPLADARLFRACDDLAELVPDIRRGAVTLDSALIEFALQRNGIIEPEARLLFGWGDVVAPGHFLAELRPKLAELLRDGGATRFGVGIAHRKPDGTAAVVFALQGSWISTLPIPRSVGARADIAIDAVIDPRYRDPEVFVTREVGDTERLAVRTGRPGGFVAQLACDDHGGRQQIEIAASDAGGATVLANFPVWCGADPPPSVTVEPADDVPVDRPEQAERYLLARVNGDRVALGLPPLMWDGAVAAVARGYSEEMRRARAVAHLSRITGSATDRLRAAHIATRVVLENVARAYGLDEAHRALMNSPGHRANLTSTEVNRIGIGVVFGDEISGRRELYITQVMTRAPAIAFDPDRCDGAAAAGCLGPSAQHW